MTSVNFCHTGSNIKNCLISEIFLLTLKYVSVQIYERISVQCATMSSQFLQVISYKTEH